MQTSFQLVTRSSLIFLSPFFFWLSWPPNQWTGLIFIVFVPHFIVYRYLVQLGSLKGRVFVILVFISTLLWNISTTYWLYKTNVATAFAIQVVNATIFTVPWILYHYVAKRSKNKLKYIFFTALWISLEYIQYHWLLSYPFLNLGNALSTKPHWIQFMEYTGVLGGSLWVLVANISLYKLLNHLLDSGISIKLFTPLAKTAGIISIPLLISIIIFENYEEQGEEVNVLIVHPNIDCRTEKYTKPQADLIDKYLNLTLEKADQDTDFIIWPETAIPDLGWVIDLPKNNDLKKIYNHLSHFKGANLITGGILYEQSTETDDLNVQYHEPSKVWYRTYNAALGLSFANNRMQIRTKEKLVQVEETITNSISYSLRKVFSSLGGFRFSHKKHDPDYFDYGEELFALPLICYESLYGEIASEKIGHKKGIRFINLNEGVYKSINGAAQI
ncbi:MAG: hypothetical protein AAF843_19810, partial [Bacteroidota bacterium]